MHARRSELKIWGLSRQRGIIPLADLEQSASSTTRVLQHHFQFAAVRTAAARKSGPRPLQGLRWPDSSHSRCRMSCGRAEQPGNSVRCKVFRRQFVAFYCATDHTNGSASVTNTTNLRPVRVRCDMPGDVAMDQRATSSKVPRRRQFWQSTQFLVGAAALG